MGLTVGFAKGKAVVLRGCILHYLNHYQGISAGWPLERIVEQWSEIRNLKCCNPLFLYLRIKGIEKVMRILGPNYAFHDSEVNSICIFSDGTVMLIIWPGWAFNANGEYLTIWKLNSCVEVHSDYFHPPHMCWLNEMRLEANGDRLEVFMNGVGPSFTCSSI